MSTTKIVRQISQTLAKIVFWIAVGYILAMLWDVFLLYQIGEFN